MAFNSLLTQDIQDKLASAVKKIRADYAEIRAEESVSTRVIFRGSDPDLIAEPQSLGFFVRVLINGSWGISTFSDFSLLNAKIEEALSFTKMQGKGDVVLSETPQVEATIAHTLIQDFRTIPLKQKVDLVKKYNHLLLTSDKGVQTTNSVYSDNFLIKFFVNSRGSRIYQQRPYVRLAFQAMARHGDVIEMYRGSHGHIGGFEVALGHDPEMISVAKEAVILAKAPKVKSGKYTVILDPYMAGTFAHEAFGHFSEADHQYQNPQILEQMAIGRKLGSEIVNIADDPTIVNGWGNFVYDDEGVLGKRVPLLTQGVITGRLHSLETAAKLGELPNGRARADGYRSKPIVRMSNTIFEGGKESYENLVKTTKKGILIVNWIAGMTAMENFTFTGMYGVMIENGKLGQKVRGTKLSGNVFETLQNIDGVSKDFDTDAGTCGKEGQHMPVGSGGGYVRINQVMVGGS